MNSDSNSDRETNTLTPKAKPKRKLVVIGNGMAGARTVEEILARGGSDQFDITVFGDEPYGNYNRILLSNVLNGTQDHTDIFLNSMEWYRENGVELHAPSSAIWIDRQNREVFTNDEKAERYDKLVIATGSRPLIPPMRGLETPEGPKPGVFVFRTLQDGFRISAYATKCRRAVVIGGGLLGLEAARGLLTHGLEVHVVHLMPWLMNLQLDEAAGKILRSIMQRTGITVHLEKKTTAILGEQNVQGLEFEDGATLDCDMVLISAGIRPNSELADSCGLAVDPGIVVDDQMRSADDKNIYAVGECAQHNGRTYGLVAPLWEQARVLADHITGANPEAAYTGSKVAAKLKIMDIDLTSMGEFEPRDEDDEVVTYSEPRRGIYKKLVLRDGVLKGAILLGDSSKVAGLMLAFANGTTVAEDRISSLFHIGPGSGVRDIAAIRSATQICNCNGVCKGKIEACVKEGNRTLKSVMDATRAGTGCGSCKKLLEELVEWACGGNIEEDPSIHYYVPGVPLKKPELVQAVKEGNLRSVSSVFNSLAAGREDVASKMGLASLLKTIWGADYEDERDARFINDRVHANIQKDRTFSVVPRIPGGVTSAGQLRRIADVAEKYNVPMVKITGGQRIDLLGIAKENLPNIWRDLEMASGHAYAKSFRTCKTCVGTDFCRYGVGDSTSLGLKIEERFAGLESPGKLKLATAGCPRNCSEAMVKDLGAVAIEGGKWEIYVGGAAGSHVRKGDILCVVDTHEEVLLYMARFIQYYRENAKYLERTYGFVERIGIERLRSIVMDDCEGIAARLDAEIERSIAAYVDPWKEAGDPATQNQFLTHLPVIQG